MLVERAWGNAARGRENHDRPRQSPGADRQLADRITIGVHHERAVARELDFSGAEHLDVRQLDMRALEHPGHHAGKETRPADVPANDEIEFPTVGPRVWPGSPIASPRWSVASTSA